MPDFDEAPGQAMKQKPPDELDGGDRDLFSPFFLSIFDVEGHHPVFKRHDTTVGNRDPVGIACQVLKNVIRSFDRITDIDNPLFLIQSGLQLFVLIAGKLEIPTLTGPFHMVHELAPKNQR